MNTIIKISVLMLAAFAIGGCGEMAMDAPDGFVQMSNEYSGDGKQRLVSADNCMLSLQCEDNLKNGTADFWATAVKAKLISKGYEFKESLPIKTTEGLDGVLLKFTKSDMSYWTALFVKGDLVYVAEAGGVTRNFVPKEPEIVKAFTSIKPKPLK